jgi:DNA-binding beta-propeller fold protein YncE
MSQVSFTIINGGAGNTIYMPTDDPKVNQISVMISSDTALTLTAGTPVEPKQAGGATGSLFYLSLKTLGLTKDELDGLSVTMAGWTTKVFSDTQFLCLTPESDMPVGVGQPLIASIGNFIASKAPSGASAQLYMNYYRAVPVSSGALPFTYNNIVTLQAPPSGQLDLHDPIAVSLSSNTIVQSTFDYPDVTNSFSLTFIPGQKPKTVMAGPKTVFTINFVYADDQYGYGALTTIGKAFDIDVNSDSGWTITDPPEASANPGWLLQPPDGQPILGTLSTVTFQFSKIVTRFQAGPTLMMISYSGVPGYQDGSFTLVINKEAHVYVHSLLASPNPAVLNDKGEAQVDLSWSATGKRLTLMPGMIDVSNLSIYTAKIKVSTLFTLISQGNSVNNYASSDIQVDIFPVINSIVATPKNIHHKDFPHDVLLDWSVNTNDEIILSTSISSSVQYFPPNATTAVTVKQPQMFTIEPNDIGLPLYIERNQVISAFDLRRGSVSLSAKPSAVALSPTANLCAVAQSGNSQILLLETITNAPYGNPISAGNGPAALAFAPAGGRFFVANGGDSTLSVFNVKFSGSSNTFVFTKVTDVNLSGVPVAVAVSADGSSIFVTSNNTNQNPGALDVVTSSDGVNYYISNSVVFDERVSTLAVLPSSAQIFVMGSAAKSVYVVGYDSINQAYQWVRTIAGFDAGDKPQDVAIAGQDSGTLLIACSGSNVVYAVPKEVQSVSGKQKLKVGSDPRRIIVVESGAYAYVANHGDSTLSLIGCFKGAGLCAVLESGLANGAVPGTLTSAADGSVVYVGNADQSLSVWSARTFTDEGALNSVTLVTSVAASRKYVASWHNFNVTIKGQTPTTGLSVYNRSTETTTLVNPVIPYLTFEFWPDDTQNIAIATQKDSNMLSVLETAKFKTVNSVAFSTAATAKAIATTISPFGNMIFVLVAEPGSVFNLVAIAADIKNNKYQLVSTVSLFTQPQASSYALAAVSDGSSAYVTNGYGRKLYVVTGSRAGYRLSGTTYDFTYLPRAMSCAPDDTELYVWMNEGSNSAFARFEIGPGVLENFVLPSKTQFQFTAMTIAPDGSRLYVCDANFGGVRVFSTSAMQNVENVAFAGASFPLGVAIAPDGSGLYMANALAGTVSRGSQLQAAPSADLPTKRAKLTAGEAYIGIFLRDYIGQTPTSNSGSGWTWSPDIVPYGINPLPDPSVLGQQANYNTDYGNGRDITLGALNNVYVRGLNTNSAAQKSRIYFYWVVSSVVQIPSQWSPYNFTFDKNLQNWLDVTAQKQGDIAYSPAPLTWQPAKNNPHYCLVAWVDNSSDPSPPNLAEWANFKTWDDVGTFIRSHPNMAWRNTNDIAIPGEFQNAQIRVIGPQEGGQVTVGVKMDSIPIDNKGTIQFTLINSNGTISYTSPVHPIDTNTFSQTIDWPANAPDPLLTYLYKPASGKLQGGEKITSLVAYWPGIALMKYLLLRAPELLIELPQGPRHAGLAGAQLMILGSVRNTYTGK